MQVLRLKTVCLQNSIHSPNFLQHLVRIKNENFLDPLIIITSIQKQVIKVRHHLVRFYFQNVGCQYSKVFNFKYEVTEICTIFVKADSVVYRHYCKCRQQL
ncbi:Hypothetical_protein [Hexamita inflata]|uniref:Hypothetical_protein n=1 Tax=Hexamita inflata TaxID=28002 RepID=A0ABP1J677_9EUKA